MPSSSPCSLLAFHLIPIGCTTLYLPWHLLIHLLQQYPYEGRWWMESRFLHQHGTLRTHSNVFWTHRTTFQSFTNSIFKPLIYHGVVAVYMDNILIFTKTNKEHITVVCKVLKILHNNSLFLKPEKCTFHQSEIEYLGLIIGNQHAHMDLTKVSAIRDWPIPTKKQELQWFLDFCNFYHWFI